jgi:hypothetical protein
VTGMAIGHKPTVNSLTDLIENGRFLVPDQRAL